MAGDSGSTRTSFRFSAFDFKRRSNPSAAFAEMFDGFRSALHEAGELAQAVALFKGGVVVTQEDATRLAALEKQGISASEFTVGSLPSAMGPGIALMYDAALEVLRSSDRRIRQDRFQPRSPLVLARSVETLMQAVGSSSVVALEMALKDPAFRDRLKERATELGARNIWTSYLAQPPGPCEFCEIVIENPPSAPERYCGTEQECADAFGFIILVLLATAIWEFLEWLFDW